MPSDGAVLLAASRSGVVVRALLQATTAVELISRGGAASVVLVDVVVRLCVAFVLIGVGVSAVLMGAVGVLALRGPVS